MDRHLFGTYTTLQKERRVRYSTSLKNEYFSLQAWGSQYHKDKQLVWSSSRWYWKSRRAKRSTFHHALPDLPHSPSVWILTLCCSQQGKLGKLGHYRSTRFDEWCIIQIQDPARRQVMGHQRPHEGKDVGSKNDDWEAHKTTWFEGICKTIR